MINIISGDFPLYESFGIIDWNSQDAALAELNYGHLDINDFDKYIVNIRPKIAYIVNIKEVILEI